MDPDGDDERTPEAELVECTMCHVRVLFSRTVVLGGRRVCFACAEAWFSDEEEVD